MDGRETLDKAPLIYLTSPQQLRGHDNEEITNPKLTVIAVVIMKIFSAASDIWTLLLEYGHAFVIEPRELSQSTNS